LPVVVYAQEQRVLGVRRISTSHSGMDVNRTGGAGTLLSNSENGVRGGTLKKPASSRVRPRSPFALWWTSALVLAAVVTAAGACASRAPAPPPATVPSAPRDTLRVRVDSRVATVALEEYVAGCVASELGSLNLAPQAAARARDVQAVLCRSYALGNVGRHAAEGFDLCSGTHCQVYRPVPSTAVGRLSSEAADRTAGRVLKLNGRPVVPVYHADCGGRTSAATDVWGGPPSPYLVSVADDGCARRPAWRFEIALDRLAAGLRQTPGFGTDGLREVRVEKRDSAGRAASIRLVGTGTRTVRGNDFRNAVVAAFGASSLRSTLFTLSGRGRTLVFEGRGNGHGVGLCQAGLIVRAGRGDLPASILSHYFPGTSVGPR
jgi:stage II sporulation protein D